MSVFTILCHGSGSHRSKPDKEIVAFLGRRMVGAEYEQYLILDGVGAKPVKGATGTEVTPMAGTFDWADRDRGAKSSKVSVEMGGSKTGLQGTVTTHKGEQRFKYGREAPKGAMTANASGYGVEDNARHAVITLANLLDSPGGMPDTVNLIGWSRGAVTCLVIANMLYDAGTTEGLFRHLKVNIFAIDPVAGDKAGTKDGAESRRLIPPNVKHYLGVLNTNENRKTFSPQDLGRVIVVDPRASNVVFLPFPGKHDSCAQNNNAKTREVSAVAWSLAARFLRNFGSEAGTWPEMLSDVDTLANYALMVTSDETLATVKQKGLFQRAIGKGFGDRALKGELDRYTKFSDYFINEHHRLLFQRLLPQTYRWLFHAPDATMAGLAGRTVDAKHPMAAEVFNFAHGRKGAWDSLALLGITTRSISTISFPAPGSGRDDRSQAYGQTGMLQMMGVMG